jgi:secretion/DNA translocation related TadE-like protein
MTVALIAVLIALTTGAGAVGAAVIGRHRAQAAADLAALAAAGSLADGAAGACGHASSIAEAMGARVSGCTVRQLDVLVDVDLGIRFGRWTLGDARGQARAGPQVANGTL